MAQKIAVILRGVPAAGKTGVADALQQWSQARQERMECDRVVLDSFWNKGEKRYEGCCRYWDLRSNAHLLIIELGWGEPEKEPSKEPAKEPFFGATMNPREWMTILKNDKREMFFFLVETSGDELQARRSERNTSDDKSNGSAEERYEPGGDCCSEAFRKWTEDPEWEEDTITGEDKDAAVEIILTKIDLE